MFIEIWLQLDIEATGSDSHMDRRNLVVVYKFLVKYILKYYHLSVKNMTEYYFAPLSSPLYYTNRTPRIMIICFSTYPEVWQVTDGQWVREITTE